MRPASSWVAYAISGSMWTVSVTFPAVAFSASWAQVAVTSSSRSRSPNCSSCIPDSMREISSRLSISACSRTDWEWMISMNSWRVSSLMSVLDDKVRENPRMEVKGVRNSWETDAMNSLLSLSTRSRSRAPWNMFPISCRTSTMSTSQLHSLRIDSKATYPCSLSWVNMGRAIRDWTPLLWSACFSADASRGRSSTRGMWIAEPDRKQAICQGNLSYETLRNWP